jgi:hypothetical protein
LIATIYCLVDIPDRVASALLRPIRLDLPDLLRVPGRLHHPHRRHRPGTDLMKLLFGRKVFGQYFFKSLFNRQNLIKI